MKDLFRLDGKVAVVIGGAGGIGQGIAEAMAFYGAEVVIASRKMESLVRAKSEIKEKVGKDVAIYTVDATNEDSIIALVNTVVSNHKKADILVNAQGYNKKFSLFDFPMDVMADMMNVNVIGVAMACKHFGKVMKENGYGRIINLSSVRGVRAFSGGGGNMGYCTSKGAVDMLTRTLAAELGPEVTVNAIGPTLTVTPMMAEVIKEHPETLNLGNGKPLERIGKVEDCWGPAGVPGLRGRRLCHGTDPLSRRRPHRDRLTEGKRIWSPFYSNRRCISLQPAGNSWRTSNSAPRI